MKILKAAGGFIDVFVGEGWMNHSRLRLIKTAKGKKLIPHSGIKLTHVVMSNLEKRI